MEEEIKIMPYEDLWPLSFEDWNFEDVSFVNDRFVLHRVDNDYGAPITYISYYINRTLYGYDCRDLFCMDGNHYDITEEEIEMYLTFQ